MSTVEVKRDCAKWGMKINVGKCRILTPFDRRIYVEEAKDENVKSFIFLGSVEPSLGDDVLRRIALASIAFGRLRKTVWCMRDVFVKLKVRLYNCLILPIAKYPLETLRVEDSGRLEVCEVPCLRALLGVAIINRMRNSHIVIKELSRGVIYG